MLNFKLFTFSVGNINTDHVGTARLWAHHAHTHTHIWLWSACWCKRASPLQRNRARGCEPAAKGVTCTGNHHKAPFCCATLLFLLTILISSDASSWKLLQSSELRYSSNSLHEKEKEMCFSALSDCFFFCFFIKIQETKGQTMHFIPVHTAGVILPLQQ